MHVHRPPVDLAAADLYAAQAAKKAAEAKKAADVRRKLLRASASIDGESSAFVSFLSREGSGGGASNGSRQDPQQGSSHSHKPQSQNQGSQQSFTDPSEFSARAPRTAGDVAADPLSIWA